MKYSVQLHESRIHKYWDRKKLKLTSKLDKKLRFSIGVSKLWDQLWGELTRQFYPTCRRL